MAIREGEKRERENRLRPSKTRILEEYLTRAVSRDYATCKMSIAHFISPILQV